MFVMNGMIEYNFYGIGEYTVQYNGDDVIFFSREEAEEFVKEMFDEEI